MRLTETLLTAISPALLIPKREWLTKWRQSEYWRFARTGRALCVAIGLLYFFHYFLVDIPAKKQPIELWAKYRFSVAGLAFVAFGMSFSPWYKKSKLFKLPALLVVAYTVYMQGQSMIWRPQVPFFYVPVIAMFGIFALRLPIVGTLLAYSAVLGVAHESFICRPAETQHMVSASLVGAVALIVLRSRLKLDIESFILEQKHLESQRALIETQLALTDQLRAFLPREIFRRVEALMANHRKTPLQAVDEVLRPRKSLAAVIHSDIRGFTGLTKTGDEVLLSSIIPAQKTCTDAVESRGGIPRLQGDLVFAYFDDQNPIINISRAAAAAFALNSVTETLNGMIEQDHQKIRRYAILSFGSVIVGNIGGSEGAREISVLGNAANLPSRIDALTKEPSLSRHLETLPVIATQDAYRFLAAIYPKLEFIRICLAEHNIVVRDFPEQTDIFLLPVTLNNIKTVDFGPDFLAGAEYCRMTYGVRIQNTSVGTEKGVAA